MSPAGELCSSQPQWRGGGQGGAGGHVGGGAVCAGEE